MKTVFIVFTIYLVVSKCYQFPEVTISKYYVPIVNIRGINESVVFLNENNTDDMLINSIILGLYSDQPVMILLKSEGYKAARKSLSTRDPNIVIFAETLSLDAVQSLKSILKSFWSPVFMVITARNGSETCENGTFNKSFLENAQDYMNEIWHNYRIIRVVLSFPYTCPYHYIIYSGTKSSKMALYDRTIKVVNAKNKKELKETILANSKLQQLTAGYPLRANIFYRFPTSINKCDLINSYKNVNLSYTNGFCGMDALIMHDFMEHYQFNLTDPNDDDCDVYGFVQPNTNFVTGSLGCIVRGRMDISFNSRFMVQYTTQRYFYLHYIATDSLAVILKRPGEIPLWYYAFSCCGPKTGIILCFLVFVIGFITWASARITKEITGQEPRKLVVYIWNAINGTLFGLPIKRGSKRFRILRGTSLFCAIILLAFYQGHVNYQFTTRTRYREIRTLKQLFNSKYVIYTSPSIQTLLMNNMNPSDNAQMTFLRQTQIKNENLGIGYVIDHQDAATIARGEDVLMEVLLNYTDEAGSPLIYVVEESFHVYYLAFIARASFLFIEESVCFMMRMLEAGLPNKYYVWTRRTMKLGDTFPKTGSEPRPASKMSLDDLRVAFFVLAFGCLLSACCFLAEVYRDKTRNKTTKYVSRSGSSRVLE